MTTIEGFFENGGPLGEILPGYRKRDEQVRGRDRVSVTLAPHRPDAGRDPDSQATGRAMLVYAYTKRSAVGVVGATTLRPTASVPIGTGLCRLSQHAPALQPPLVSTSACQHFSLSANYVEGEFSEVGLPFYGVLGSSPADRNKPGCVTDLVQPYLSPVFHQRSRGCKLELCLRPGYEDYLQFGESEFLALMQNSTSFVMSSALK
jgi:hypothetical protein